ncbi:hypothetical protein V8C86DRAFT_2914750 [Haematococcus lacustris]
MLPKWPSSDQELRVGSEAVGRTGTGPGLGSGAGGRRRAAGVHPGTRPEAGLLALLSLVAPTACSPPVLRLLVGPRIAQLLVALTRLAAHEAWWPAGRQHQGHQAGPEGPALARGGGGWSLPAPADSRSYRPYPSHQHSPSPSLSLSGGAGGRQQAAAAAGVGGALLARVQPPPDPLAAVMGLVEALLREIVREGGRKLPSNNARLLAELVAACGLLVPRPSAFTGKGDIGSHSHTGSSSSSTLSTGWLLGQHSDLTSISGAGPGVGVGWGSSAGGGLAQVVWRQLDDAAMKLVARAVGDEGSDVTWSAHPSPTSWPEQQQQQLLQPRSQLEWWQQQEQQQGGPAPPPSGRRPLPLPIPDVVLLAAAFASTCQPPLALFSSFDQQLSRHLTPRHPARPARGGASHHPGLGHEAGGKLPRSPSLLCSLVAAWGAAAAPLSPVVQAAVAEALPPVLPELLPQQVVQLVSGLANLAAVPPLPPATASLPSSWGQGPAGLGSQGQGWGWQGQGAKGQLGVGGGRGVALPDSSLACLVPELQQVLVEVLDWVVEARLRCGAAAAAAG